MDRFTDRSILRELSTTDAPQIRRIVETLAERLHGAQARAVAVYGGLSGDEGVVVERINLLTQGNSTLLDMAERFASAWRTSNTTVVQAATEFNTRATYVVQRQAPPGPWAQAQTAWNSDVEQGLHIYDAFGMNYLPDDSEEEDEVSQVASSTADRDEVSQ
jgi:hypothetical protein